MSERGAHGNHRDGSRLLSGVRVADLSRVLAGPYAAAILAELGADVVKVEPPAGDPARQIGPFRDGRSVYFEAVNRGKRGITLDLTDDDDHATLDRLLATCDIAIENYLPSVGQRLGVTPARLLDAHPRLILVTISSYDSRSPRRDDPAFDLVVQAEAGLMSVTGEPGRPPVRVGVPVGDLAAGLWGAIGSLAAVTARQLDGHGRHIEVPLFDATMSLLSYVGASALATAEEPVPVGSGHHSVVPYGAFPTMDGWVAIAALGDRYWRPLCDAMELPELAADSTLADSAQRVAARERVNETLAQATASMTTKEALTRLAGWGVPSAPVNGVLDALRSPYAQEMNVAPEATAASPRVVAGPLVRGVPVARAPTLGEHNQTVRKSLERRGR